MPDALLGGAESDEGIEVFGRPEDGFCGGSGISAPARDATESSRTLVIEKQPDGKMRVTSGSWEGEKVFLRDQVLEVRNAEGRLHVGRKERQHDVWDPPIDPYDPLRESERVIDDAGRERMRCRDVIDY